MDRKLVSWAYAVKARQRRQLHRAGSTPLPPLWVFSDRIRLPDPSAVLLRLPKALCGVVLRNVPEMAPACLSRTLSVCRARRFPVVMVRSGHSAIAASRGLGRHFPGKARIQRVDGGFATAAAHSPAELMRATRRRLDCVFLSPVLSTRSHPGANTLGPLRWRLLARRARVPMMALGGVTGETIRLLGAHAAGAGAIGALMD